MSDASAPSAPVVPGAVVPGNQTSEYRTTIIATALSVLATVTGVALDILQSAADAGVQGKWIALGLSIFGVIGTVLTAIGYQVTRARVKAAAQAAAAHVAAANATVNLAPEDAARAVFAAPLKP